MISSFLYLRELAVMADCFYWMCMHEGRRQVCVPVRSDHTSLCSLTGHKNRVQTPRGSARLNWRGDDFQYQPFIRESQNKEAFQVVKRHRSGWTMVDEKGWRNRRHRLVKCIGTIFALSVLEMCCPSTTRAGQSARLSFAITLTRNIFIILLVCSFFICLVTAHVKYLSKQRNAQQRKRRKASENIGNINFPKYVNMINTRHQWVIKIFCY